MITTFIRKCEPETSDIRRKGTDDASISLNFYQRQNNPNGINNVAAIPDHRSVIETVPNIPLIDPIQIP